MKRKTATALMITGYVLLIGVMLVFSLVPIAYTDNATANNLISSCIVRALGSAIAITSCVFIGKKYLVNPLHLRTKRSLLWCIPCLLVVLANFPFSALILKTCAVTQKNLVWLFVIDCILIGIFEEFLFRGLIQSIFSDVFRGKKFRALYSVLVTSAIFAVWHFLNLLDGAGIGETLLQVGYSFLIGGMLSSVMLRTENGWICVFLHALFDCGGYLISLLGEGEFQDTCFWVLTGVIGALCLGHVLYYLLKTVRQEFHG